MKYMYMSEAAIFFIFLLLPVCNYINHKVSFYFYPRCFMYIHNFISMSYSCEQLIPSCCYIFKVCIYLCCYFGCVMCMNVCFTVINNIKIGTFKRFFKLNDNWQKVSMLYGWPSVRCEVNKSTYLNPVAIHLHLLLFFHP